MAEVFSTVGLVTDVVAVLFLIWLAHAETGTGVFLPPKRQGLLGGFMARVSYMWKSRREVL